MFFYLYLVSDIYSRKIEGWQIQGFESSALAADMMIDTCHRKGVIRDQVTLRYDHRISDNYVGNFTGARCCTVIQSTFDE
jgi:hypothetical protein